MTIQLTGLADAGNDVLEVTGTVDGQPVTARGWLSATTNHYGPEAYGPDGHRLPDAQARRMTPDEAYAYALRLLAEAAPPTGRSLI